MIRGLGKVKLSPAPAPRFGVVRSDRTTLLVSQNKKKKKKQFTSTVLYSRRNYGIKKIEEKK